MRIKFGIMNVYVNNLEEFFLKWCGCVLYL